MASKSDIKAGGAFVELYVKNKLAGGLSGGLKDLRNAALGMAAAGAAILAPLTAAVAHFTQAGGALFDMSQRTGVAAKRLAFFQFAASQTGTSIEAIEKAIRFAQKQGFTPENFEEMGKQIGAIPDPTMRVARALQLAGKGGAELIPLFMELDSLQKRWKELDIAPSEESIKLADELGDLWDDLKSVASALAFEVGAALAPAMREVVKFIIPLAREVGKFVKANPQLVTGLAALGATLFVVGSAVAAVAGTLAPMVVVAGAAFAVLATEAAPIAAIIFLIAAAAVTATVAFFRWTTVGRLAFSLMSRGAGEFGKKVSKVFEDVANALKGGDISLAWEIVVTNMSIIWHKFAKMVLESIAKMDEAIVKSVFGLSANLILKSEISIATIAKELARGQGLDAKLAEARLKMLSSKARAAGASGVGNSGSQNQPGGGPTGATVIGFNPHAALLGRQVIGGGRNAVVDTLQRMIKQDQKHHEENMRAMRQRNAAAALVRVR